MGRIAAHYQITVVRTNSETVDVDTPTHTHLIDGMEVPHECFEAQDSGMSDNCKNEGSITNTFCNKHEQPEETW